MFQFSIVLNNNSANCILYFRTMDELNILTTNDDIISKPSTMSNTNSVYALSDVNNKNNLTPNLSNYDESRGFLDKISQAYDIHDYNEPGSLNFAYDEYDEGINVNSSPRNFPQKFPFPKFQRNYVDEDYAIDYEEKNQGDHE